LQGLISVF